ncbi:Cellulose synthase catalytic subunit [UDP-forming] [Thiorhodovibrio winogradskyi]|uniref:Cellulose synthase catalytic subunit [UDP-forming] n=1 Tax=Thiorhodovibrio winogradskyi TaxID=77007 RepID=A0ABZ0SAT7_9GAMM|nr:glycosyltransferase family 2 protein [Thiorhodovibrio winogradskyi]
MSTILIDHGLGLSTQTISLIPLGLMGLLGMNLGTLAWLRSRPPRAAKTSVPQAPTPAPAPAAVRTPPPAVVVQIPVFNEGLLVRSCLEAVARLDYPAGQLSVQLLDDSDDGSAADNRRLAGEIAARTGLPIAVIQRGERTGFKAGALAAGLARTQAELAMVLDADFRPDADFLRRALPALIKDPGVGFVQARWAHRNSEVSWLTRTQATLLDAHFRVEQAARHIHGLPVAFNGTCGVWRVAAIAAAGGWQGDTLSEDLDLSLRTQLAGYRAIYLDDLPVSGELLTSARAWQQQQFRWTKGHLQVLRKLGPRLLTAPWSPLTRLAMVLQIAQGLFFPLAFISLLLTLPGVILDLTPNGLGVGLVSLVGLGGLLGAGWFLGLGRQLSGCSWQRILVETAGAMILLGGLLISNTRAALEGLAGRSSAFIRSDKQGAGIPRVARTGLAINALPFGQSLAGIGILGLFFIEHAWNAPFLATTALGLLAVALPQLLSTVKFPAASS